MNSYFVNKRNELLDVFDDKSNILITKNHVVNDRIFAYDLIKPDTKAMYEVCECQYTVSSDVNEPIVNILNERGLKLYNDVLEKVSLGIFKDEITQFAIDRVNSGAWFANESSSFYDVNSGLRGCLNSFNNLCIQGRTSKGPLTTSVCIFINNPVNDGKGWWSGGWCYTRSGSLYKLGEKMTLSDFMQVCATF